MSAITKTAIVPKPPVPFKKPGLKLNHLVYAKYRDMLKSYNEKANGIIDNLPSAAVLHIDYGFDLKEKDIM